ncbi:MAG: glycosyltransferase [Arcticibacter sp.]
MKIVQVIDSLEFGGAERMAVNMANAFVSHKDRSVLVATRKIGGLHSDLKQEVVFHFVGKRFVFDFSAFIKFYLIIKREKPDILHAHSTSVFWCMLIKLWLPNTKIVWHHHLGLSDLVKAKPRPLIIWLSNWFHGALLVNKRLLDWAKLELRCTRNRIAYIPNFSDIEPSERTGLFFEKGIKILHLANFRHQKDHMNLLEAVLILKNRGRNFKCTLAGSHIDVQITAKVKRFIAEHDLADHVLLAGAVVNIHYLMEQHNVGVLSSVSEGYPVSLIEYGMGQLFVVSTNAGQCADILEYGKLGMVVPVKDPIALADALEQIWLNPFACEKMAKDFQQKVIQAHGKDAFVNQYKSTFFE